MPATQRKCTYGRLTMDVDRHYIGCVTATTHQEKGIITLESNPSLETVLPAPHCKGNKCDKNVKYKRTDAPSLWHKQYSTTVDIHGPLQTRGEKYISNMIYIYPTICLIYVYILTGKRNVTKYRCNLFHNKNEKIKLSYVN